MSNSLQIPTFLSYKMLVKLSGEFQQILANFLDTVERLSWRLFRAVTRAIAVDGLRRPPVGDHTRPNRSRQSIWRHGIEPGRAYLPLSRRTGDPRRVRFDQRCRSYRCQSGKLHALPRWRPLRVPDLGSVEVKGTPDRCRFGKCKHGSGSPLGWWDTRQSGQWSGCAARGDNDSSALGRRFQPGGEVVGDLIG